MCISMKADALTAEIFCSVREAAGFLPYGNEDVKIALQGQLFSVVAYDDDKPVGIGRIIGDGRIAFFIKDVAVLPEYRNRGVGSRIMRELIDYARAFGCHNAYLGLMSSVGSEHFYRKLGFIERPTDTLGNGFVMYLNV